jgi:hypothetical protein
MWLRFTTSMQLLRSYSRIFLTSKRSLPRGGHDFRQRSSSSAGPNRQTLDAVPIHFRRGPRVLPNPIYRAPKMCGTQHTYLRILWLRHPVEGVGSTKAFDRLVSRRIVSPCRSDWPSRPFIERDCHSSKVAFCTISRTRGG